MLFEGFYCGFACLVRGLQCNLVFFWMVVFVYCRPELLSKLLHLFWYFVGTNKQTLEQDVNTEYIRHTFVFRRRSTRSVFESLYVSRSRIATLMINYV